MKANPPNPSFVDHFLGPILTITETGIILSWNEAAQRVFGYSAEEALGKSFTALLVPEERAAESDRRRDIALATGNAIYDSIKKTKSGKLIDVEVAYQLLEETDAGKKILAINIRDTAQLKYARQGKLLEARLHGLLEAAPDAMIIVDPSGRIVLSNSQVESLFGYDRDELLGSPIEMLVPRWLRGGEAVPHEQYGENVQGKLLEPGLELQGRRKNGTEFPVEINLRPLRTEDGSLVSGAIRDITDRKRSEERFRALLESAPDAIVIIDSDGRIVLVNAQAERLFGYSREKLLHQPIELLVPADIHGHPQDHFLDVFSDQPTGILGSYIELIGRRRDGTELPIEISFNPLTTDEGNLVFSSIRDITERKRAEKLAKQAEDLAQSNAELQQFAHVASHDLQEPLRMVTSYAQLLETRYKGKLDADADVFLGFMIDGARRMQALIEGLLAYSRVGFKHKPFGAVDCNVAVQEAIHNLSKAIADAQATINCGGLPAVKADHRQLIQLFQNLIGNAVKFRGTEPPQIQVSASEDKNGWLFSISDNGIGIGLDHVDRIFLIFQRLHLASEYPGTGIGLAICKRIVEGHGGKIWVESTPGRGSIFYFTLPAGWSSEHHAPA